MRLNKTIREEIVHNAMRKAFSERDKKHKEATAALGDAIHEHEYGEVAKQAAKLPTGWVNYQTYIRIDSPGYHWRGRNGDKPSSIETSGPKPTPRYSEEIKIQTGHPLFDRAQALADEYKEIEKDRETLHNKLQAIVSSATTIKKLRELWPECEQFLPSSAPKPVTDLVPVELVTEVNAALGIK